MPAYLIAYTVNGETRTLAPQSTRAALKAANSLAKRYPGMVVNLAAPDGDNVDTRTDELVGWIERREGVTA